MKRKKIIAGNWKLNKNIAETKVFLKQLLENVKNQNLQTEIIVIPTFTSLAAAYEIIKGSQIKLGAQDLSEYESGAYTGEVSAEMLKEIGVSTVLVGHSERREIFKENDEVINTKVKRALSANLDLILCCGEPLTVREANQTDAWVTNQIELALEGAQIKSANALTIAYEPIWAIGTGKTCDASEANRVIKIIREKLKALLGKELAEAACILYGGSVKPDTIEGQMAESDIDGALVGGASLKVEDFSKIISGASLSKV